MAINSSFNYTSFLNNNLVSQDWTSVMNQMSSGGLNMSALTSAMPSETYGIQAYQSAAALSSLSQLQSGWGSILGGSSLGSSFGSAYGSSFGSSLESLGSSLSSFGAPYTTTGYGSSYGSSYGQYGNTGSYGSPYGQSATPPPPHQHHGHHHHQEGENGQQNWNGNQNYGNGQNWGAGGMLGRNNWGGGNNQFPQNNWGGQENCPPFGNQGNWGGSNGVDSNCQNGYGNGVSQTGTLTQDGGDGSPISYQTTGGWNINVDGSTTTFTDPTGKQTLQYSGDPHEYLNGEHVKDWEDGQRTLELPDGTKVTLSATAANGATTGTTIYDGNTAYQIDNSNNTVTSTTTGAEARQREQTQYDGETAQLSYNNTGGLNYTNLYTQNADFSTTSNLKDIANTTLAADGTVAVKDNYEAS